MGIDGASRRAGLCGERSLTADILATETLPPGTLTTDRVAQVVPDLPSFALDRGFAYRVPPDLETSVSIGSIVRVPLSGRRVRGYVVGLDDRSADGLKDIRSVSGAWPCFDAPMLQTLRWAATYYVAPLSVILAKTGPPNLARNVADRKLPSLAPINSPLRALTASATAGRHARAAQILAEGDWGELIRALIRDPVAAGRSVGIILPTVVEAKQMADALGGDFGRRIVEVTDQTDASMTTAWSLARQQGGLVVIGTPKLAWWPIRDLALMVLIEDGRRGMKERQTPSVAVRSLARRRASVERFPLVHIGRVPTVETLAEGTAITTKPGRLWPLVEVVDRTEEPPGGGVVTQRARAAIAGAARKGHRTFVFTHRHGYAPASRCASCRELRTCGECGARPDPGTVCSRCSFELGPCVSCGGRRFEPLGAAVGRVIEELRRVVDPELVGQRENNRLVTVGTERDLAGLEPVDLAVAIDADGLVRGTNYRSAEDALAILARVAATVSSDTGRRMMMQTADPRHPIFEALKRGRPRRIPWKHELKERIQLSLPPVGEVIVLEVRGLEEPPTLAELESEATVFEPGANPGGLEVAHPGL